MIARLTGRLEDKTAGVIIVMAGGVGYEVFIPVSTFYDLPSEGEEVTLHVKTVVRDDSFELFGFLTPDEKEAFLILNSVSKIGPRLALSILSGIHPAELVEAVTNKDVGRLNMIPGVGTKTAERLILELKDKISRLASVAAPIVTAGPGPEVLDGLDTDVVSALLNLGYRQNEAEKAVSQARRSADGANIDLAGLLRLSLKELNKT